MSSPFAQYANLTILFQVPTGTNAINALGNPNPRHPNVDRCGLLWPGRTDSGSVDNKTGSRFKMGNCRGSFTKGFGSSHSRERLRRCKRNKWAKLTCGESFQATSGSLRQAGLMRRVIRPLCVQIWLRLLQRVILC